MFKDLTEVYSKHFYQQVNAELYSKIQLFRVSWAQKSEHYIEFLGSNLTGIQASKIRFSQLDENELFVNVFEIDRDQLQYDLWKTSGIDKKNKVGSNATYITLVYLMHRFTVSRDIGQLRDQAIEELYYIFAYKVISSIFSAWWKYDTDPAVAKAVLENLSNKYLIKKLNSWQEVFQYRAQDLIGKGLHAARLRSLKTKDIVYIVTDLQSRIRDMLKNIYREIVEVQESGVKVTTTSGKTEDGKVKDLTDNPEKYSRYLLSIIKLQHDFVDTDLIHLVLINFKNIKPEYLYNTLVYISNNDVDKLDNMVSDTIETCFNILKSKNLVKNFKKNIPKIMLTIKNTIPNNKSPEMQEARNILNKVIRNGCKYNTTWLVQGLILSTIIYIVVKALLLD